MIDMDEFIDHRYLGALKLVDRATGFHLNRAMRITAQDVSLFRNRSNLYVIKDAIGLELHIDSFLKPPALPARESLPFSVEVSDPLNQYLPRTIKIALPRDADPENSENEDSMFNPIDVKLYAAPNANVMANWSTIRVSVQRQDADSGNLPVAGGLLRVVRNSDDKVLSSGLTDQRGEALVIVPGIPITQFAEDDDNGPGGRGDRGRPGDPPPVVISEIPVSLELSLAADPEWPANPDVLELNHVTNLVATENLSLRTGQMEKVTIQLT